jgi:hypothetical protein
MKFVTLTPLPGTDYKSAAAALVDYHAGKDFMVNRFDLPKLPINKSQCEEEEFTVTLRYNKLRSEVTV